MPQLSVIVPAYNERDNLAPLTAALASALDGTDYEVVIVDDDSPDGTGALARQLAQDNPAHQGDPAHRAARPCFRRRRGRAVHQQPVHRGDRRRPAARRAHPAGDAA